MLEAGKLRHRVLIERFALDVDTDGDVIQDSETGQTSGQWVEVATVWASIEPLSAREFIAAQSMQSQVTDKIVIRYRAGLNAAMRLVHMLAGGVRGQVYNPAGFLADKDSGLEYLTIPVTAGVSVSGQ